MLSDAMVLLSIGQHFIFLFFQYFSVFFESQYVLMYRHLVYLYIVPVRALTSMVPVLELANLG